MKKLNGKNVQGKLEELEPIYTDTVLEVITQMERAAATEARDGEADRAVAIRSGVILLSRLLHGETIIGPLHPNGSLRKSHAKR